MHANVQKSPIPKPGVVSAGPSRDVPCSVSDQYGLQHRTGVFKSSYSQEVKVTHPKVAEYTAAAIANVSAHAGSRRSVTVAGLCTQEGNNIQGILPQTTTASTLECVSSPKSRKRKQPMSKQTASPHPKKPVHHEDASYYDWCAAKGVPSWLPTSGNDTDTKEHVEKRKRHPRFTEVEVTIMYAAGEPWKWTTRESLRVSCKLTSLTRLNEWRTTGALCDVTIKAGDGVTLHAHRAVLAVSSPYFFAMFTSGLQESSSGQITMETFSGQLLEQVINFMYTGGILLTVAVAQELLMLTDMLQMDQLKEKCEQFMLEHIDANNCLGMVQFGQKYSCCQLSDKAFSLVKKRFPVVVCSEDFLLLPQELLTEIIQTKDLYLGPTGEDVVLSALMKWIEHDMTSRIPSLHTLLPLINIASVSPLYLTILKQKSSISDNPEILSVLDEWASATFAGIDRIPQEHIYVIGGYFQSRTGPTCPRTPNVERFDVHSKEWSTVAPLPNLPSSIFAFNMQGRLLVISVVKIEVGSDVQRIWLFEYNYLEDNWRDLTLSVNAKVLDACKDALGVTGAMAYCSVRHCLYLLTIDAFYRVSIFEPDGDLVLDTVEVLAPLRRLSDMDTSKRHEDELTLTCHDGAVYAFGGTVRLSELDYWPSDQVSCYNSHTDRWMPGTPMLSARARVGAVSLGRSIYTVGGFGKLRENSVEKYNLEDDSWEDMAAMNSRRSHFCTVTAAGKIWAIAGKSYAFGCGGARKVLKTIESYDPSTDKWTTHEPMAVARCGFAAVVL